MNQVSTSLAVLSTTSVGDKVWPFSGFSSAPCELSATSVGDGVLLCSVLSCSVLGCSFLGFCSIHAVTSEEPDDSPFIALGGMAAALAKGARAARRGRFELEMSTDPMGGMICVDTCFSRGFRLDRAQGAYAKDKCFEE